MQQQNTTYSFPCSYTATPLFPYNNQNTKWAAMFVRECSNYKSKYSRKRKWEIDRANPEKDYKRSIDFFKKNNHFLH